MKIMTLMKTVLVAATILGTTMFSARADHATNFLDALATEVQTRIDNADPNATAQEQRALTSASRTLNRNSRTLGADVGLLASASTTLERGFPGDAIFAALEDQAVDNYGAEAQSQLNATAARAGTNTIPRALSNQLSQAQAAIDRSSDTSNSIPVRARAVAFALNKVRAANILANRLFKAPLSLEGSTLTLGRESDHDAFNVTLRSDHTYTIAENGDEAEENGTWDYGRTSAKTGTLTLSPTTGGSHTLDLKFANSRRGTFTGETAEGESVRGRFTISTQ
jgi:hypothetical protein